MKPVNTKIFHSLLIAFLLTAVFSSVTDASTHAANHAVTKANTNDAGYKLQTIINMDDIQPVLYAAPEGLINGTCSTWGTACELRYALVLANSGQEIWVKAGTYKPTDSTQRSIAFQLKAGVAVYGGFAGMETDRTQRDPVANITILSGDLNEDDGDNFENNSENSFHVVLGATDATLDGVTISGGNANESNPNDRGGGVLSNAANPTLANIIISHNAAYAGAGMYNDSSSPAMTNVTFNDNAASYSGGGMQNYANSNPTLTNVIFSNNSAQYGGGMFNNSSSPSLTDVTFFSNRATTQYGGGMHNEANSRPILNQVTFKNNTASNHGGGMFNTGSTPTLTNVTFYGNSTRDPNSWGGGMSNWGCSPILTNVTFSGNSTYWASGGGGGMANFTNSKPQIQNSIFWGNAGLNGPQIFNGGDTEASIIKDSVIPGCPTHSVCTDIITTDPLIGSLGSYGGLTETFPLLPGSSAIKASNNNCPTIDQRGIVRSMPFCDIGAFESRGFTMAISGGSPQSAGINTVFASPLSILVSSEHNEPVTGGRVSFTTPLSGGSATLSVNPAVIDASGFASATATANGTVSALYNINASAKGANSISFALTNLQTYTVTYNGNSSTGGSVPVDPGNPYVENSVVTVLGNTGSLVRTGYTFNGWNLMANGLGTGYVPDQTFLMPSANVTLFARWILNNYDVTFDSQSGSDVSSQTVSHGGLITQPADPTRPGFSFNGWYTSVSGGTRWNFSTNTVTMNTTLYARWVLNNYDVTFDSQSGSDVSSQTVSHGGLITQPDDPTRPGFSFNGWYTSVSGGTLWNFSTNTVTMNTTLYAQWTDNSAPSVITFSATSPVNDYIIPITSFSATDNVAITGFMITDSSAAPLADDEAWNDSPPTAYTVYENGVYVLYPWAKDAAGNVSPVYNDSPTVTVQKNDVVFLYLPLIVR